MLQLQGILTSKLGLTTHVVNLLVHILLPMVVVHTKAKAFSLGKHSFYSK